MTSRVVALVGRANVGKSTLFNRFIGERLAIVEDVPGTTRDRLYGEAEWNDQEFFVIDTGGLEPIPMEREAPAAGRYIAEIRTQVDAAIEEADVVVLVTDVREGVTPADAEITDVLRRAGKPVLVAVNKVDNEMREHNVYEFYSLGVGDPFPVSAIHGLGVGDLLDAITAALPPEPQEPAEAKGVAIAIAGRPNVGKSSLLNALLREERTIVSDIPGTTRDAIDTLMEWENEQIVLIDTAGIRRRGRIDPGIEKYSVLRALRAVSRADVVLLLIDAVEGVTAQDAHIAGYILEEYKSVVVVVNKWDLVVKDTYTMNEYTAKIRSELKFLDYVPVLFISALTKQRVANVIPTAMRVYQQRMVRVKTGELNRLMAEVVTRHAPPSGGGRRLKFFYATQTDVAPPTFVFFVNDRKLVHFSYERYIENRLRDAYVFEGTPIKLLFRNRGEE